MKRTNGKLLVRIRIKVSCSNKVRYLFLFLGIGYIFFYGAMKRCLHLSVQLTYQDCFKCFGAYLRPTLYLIAVISSSDLLMFLKNNPVHGMHQVMPKFFD